MMKSLVFEKSTKLRNNLHLREWVKGILRGVAFKKFIPGTSPHTPISPSVVFQIKEALSNVRFVFMQNFIRHKTFPMEGADTA